MGLLKKLFGNTPRSQRCFPCDLGVHHFGKRKKDCFCPCSTPAGESK